MADERRHRAAVCGTVRPGRIASRLLRGVRSIQSGRRRSAAVPAVLDRRNRRPTLRSVRRARPVSGSGGCYNLFAMTRVRASVFLCLVVGLVVSALPAQSLPSRLSDQEFWRVSTELSEPDGAFRSDNLLSNEWSLQSVVPDLLRTVKS